jgi:hypothetical protein
MSYSKYEMSYRSYKLATLLKTHSNTFQFSNSATTTNTITCTYPEIVEQPLSYTTALQYFKLAVNESAQDATKPGEIMVDVTPQYISSPEPAIEYTITFKMDHDTSNLLDGKGCEVVFNSIITY